MNELEEIGAPGTGAIGRAEGAPKPPPEQPPEGWRRDAAGREFITIPGRRGPLYRRGEESISERVDRANRPKDEKPTGKGKRKQPPKQPPPKDVDLKGIELALTEALRSPAMIAGLAGDVWLANHFATQAPRLARNLVVAAENNPWLRRQLEQMATGGAAAVTIISLIGLAGGILAYAAPPIIYLFNLPAPEMARLMFDIPPPRNGRPAPPPAEPAAAQVA